MAEILSPVKEFDFRQGAALNSALTFSRKGEASFYGADGYLHFDQQGSNMLTHSEDFTTSDWTRTGSVVQIPGTISTIDGSKTANKITEKNVSGEHRVSRTLTVTQDIPLTISIYVKAGTCDKVQFSFLNGSSFRGGNPGVKFNLSTGKFYSTSSNVLSYQASNSGDGWWRLKITGLPDLGTTSGLHIYMLNNNYSINYAGNDDNYLYAWGAQFEQGSNATTYIPNTVVTNLGLRYNYDLDGTPTLVGALIEAAATNLVRYSQLFDNSFWRKQYANVVTSGSRSPDGTLNAFKLKEDNNSSSHYIVADDSISTSSGSTYTFSAFLRASERKWAYFNINGATAHFDLANGITGSFNPRLTSTFIESAGNGWYRCSATFVADSSSTSAKIGPEPSNGTPSYRGDGNSGILIWGIQLEKGEKMTSYIRTKESPATRNADEVILPKPSSEDRNDIFVQRKDGGTWLVNQSENFEVSASENAVQMVNFYSPNQPIELKDETAQQLFPTEYTSVGETNTRVMILGTEYNSQTPGKSWSLQHAINKTSPVFRVQVNSGDKWIGDANSTRAKERSEFYQKNANLPYNQDIWVSYSIRILPGKPLEFGSSEACFIGQFHASEDDRDVSSSPVLGLRLNDVDTMTIYTCATTDNPHRESPKTVLRGTTQLPRGEWHRIVMRVRFSPTKGQLQFWKNGKELLNLSGIGIGYPDETGPYWKFGIYRNANPVSLTVEYANMEITKSSSLYSRVSKPLAIA
jgi:hypothetical protein